MRVLAFEDRVDIEALLISGGIDLSEIELDQRWDTEDALDHIQRFAPDILLLDHYIAPLRGLEVLRRLNAGVARGDLDRPAMIVGISSMGAANRKMVGQGADEGLLKHLLAELSIWNPTQ